MEDEDARLSEARRRQVTAGRGSSLSTHISGGVEGCGRVRQSKKGKIRMQLKKGRGGATKENPEG